MLVSKRQFAEWKNLQPERFAVSPDRLMVPGWRCPACAKDGLLEIEIMQFTESKNLIYGDLSCNGCFEWVTDIMVDELPRYGFTVTFDGVPIEVVRE